ncbi:prevent-host-death protein [Caballeronia jiangsuensis]|nr:prevent-host-death protein [Caballeronia jiangsuensis]
MGVRNCFQSRIEQERIVETDEQTMALLAILELGRAEIESGRFRDVEDFLRELELDSGQAGNE